VAEIIALNSKSHVPAELVILPACQQKSKLRSVIKPNKKLAEFLFHTMLFREELLTLAKLVSSLYKSMNLTPATMHK